MTTIDREKKIVRLMIGMYCKKHHHHENLCPDCEKLANYSYDQINKCRYNPQKPPCQKCETHCFRKDERNSIRRVMRYAGPRMIYRHPLEAIRHILSR